MTFAIVKIALCNGSNCCNVTFATVLQPSMISMLQLHFATVLKTVVTTVAIVSATVINRPYMLFSAHNTKIGFKDCNGYKLSLYTFSDG
jgi:hypothetical protein